MRKFTLNRRKLLKIAQYGAGALVLAVIIIQSLVIRQLYMNDQQFQNGEVKI